MNCLIIDTLLNATSFTHQVAAENIRISVVNSCVYVCVRRCVCICMHACVRTYLCLCVCVHARLCVSVWFSFFFFFFITRLRMLYTLVGNAYYECPILSLLLPRKNNIW